MKSPTRLLTLLTLVLCCFGMVRAQHSPGMVPGGGAPDNPAKAVIKGLVVDADTEAPLEFATVTVFNQKDSSLVNGGITDDKGQFFIEVKPGTYRVSVEFLAYQPLVIDNIVLSRENPVADLGKIRLVPDAETLTQVEVVAEKSQMQLSLDKRIFNVGKDLSNAGGTAEDILDNVPSVTVDIDGNVSLRGSANVRILVDGKPSSLVGISGTNGLKQLPANMIDRIEVVTNPSAKYEAEGMAGIINIVLKKQNRQGFNGSFDLTGGIPESYGATANLNYRRDRFNFFVNYGINKRNRIGGGNQYTEFFSNDTTFITRQDRDNDRGGLSNNIRFGADYYFNPKNILTTAFSYRTGKDDNFASLNYYDYLFDLNNPIGSTYRTDNEKEDDSNLEYNLTYRKSFEEKGREFVLDVQYDDRQETERSDFLEQYYDENGVLLSGTELMQRSRNEEGQNQLRITADYTHPLGKDGKFEAGMLASFREINNDYLVEEFRDSDWEVMTNLSNNFIYNEDIQAAYAILGNKSGKLSYQAGLRMERSKVLTELVTSNEINDRSYVNFFPSAHIAYEMADQNSFQLSYSRRVRRPRFWDLNPFFTFSDSRNQWSGNPNLDPEFTDSYEIGHLKYWEKGSLSSSIYYRHTTDVIERIRTFDNEGISYTRPENLSNQDDYGLEFNWSYDPLKTLRLNGNFNFFRSITEGTFEDQDFSADTYSWFTRFTSKLTLWKELDVQTTFNYRAPRETTQGRAKAMYHLDLGMSRDILKKKGTLTLSVRDLFNTRKRRYITEGDNFYTEGEFQWHSRQIRLSFNYRINQKKQRQRGGRNGGDFEGGDMEF